jgi:hypothetical protein
MAKKWLSEQSSEQAITYKKPATSWKVTGFKVEPPVGIEPTT